jgi:RNA polymerase sigma factor (sigma-70 family)
MTQISKAVEGARQAAIAGLTDAELLSCLLDRRDDVAFAALVQRHAPMVWGVCRRLLGHQDAEDAFQAVFLVLFRRAGAIRPRSMLANWLYGVAHQTSLHARRTNARRTIRERQVPTMPEPAAKDMDAQLELRNVLDAELGRLPDRYRAVIVLCDLEGNTRKEAARQLGCPEGTVAGHLARGRAMLARRLRRRCIGVSGGALAAVLSQKASAVPPSIVASTVTAVVTQTTPAKVAVLAEGVLKAMLVTKLTKTLAIVLVLGLIAMGATLAGTTGQDVNKPAALEKRVDVVAKQEPITAWGEVVGGLQAGLMVRPGRKTYHYGETVVLVVRVRNVGKEAVNFQYVRQFLDENPPTVTDPDGKAISQHGTEVLGFHSPVDVTVEPGKEIELESRLTGGPSQAGQSGFRYELWPTSSRGKTRTEEQPLFVGTGKLTLQYERVLGSSSAGGIKLDPILSKLGTGKLELDVKPAASEQDSDLTTWGKEVGGLQAGLSISNRNTIQIGGKATAVVKLRNLGRKSITVSVWPLWLTGPQVVDTQGKQVRATRAPQPDFEIVPTKITLQPGQTVEMDKGTIFVAGSGDEDQPVPEGVVDRFTIYVRPGSYRVRFAGFLQEHPTLATGTMEFNVKDAEDRLTAWGKEAGGLQAGLEIRPGKRVYHHGDTVTLLVRIRNVSKNAVKFEYIRQFLDENPPTVTDANGKTVSQVRLALLGEHGPMEVSLEPGKEIVLESRLNGVAGLKYGLKPDLGTGKVSFLYERVLGNSSSGFIKLDPALSKLATGKLELEIKSAAPEQQEDDTAWGKEVDGLLCRLRTDKKGDVPTFKLTVRNLGKRELMMHMAECGCEIEFDGTWFRWQGPVSIIAGPWPAGRRYDDCEISVSLGSRWQDAAGKSIKLTPGKHTIRVAYVSLDPRMSVRAVSNAVEIAIAPR